MKKWILALVLVFAIPLAFAFSDFSELRKIREPVASITMAGQSSNDYSRWKKDNLDIVKQCKEKSKSNYYINNINLSRCLHEIYFKSMQWALVSWHDYYFDPRPNQIKTLGN